jgi:hypothetical protein
MVEGFQKNWQQKVNPFSKHEDKYGYKRSKVS